MKIYYRICLFNLYIRSKYIFNKIINFTNKDTQDDNNFLDVSWTVSFNGPDSM